MKYPFFMCFLLMGYHSNAQNKMMQEEWLSIFITDYAKYKMDIQAAGIANILAATFDENVLMIEYAYFSEEESREGKMILTFNSATNRFDGNW